MNIREQMARAICRANCSIAMTDEEIECQVENGWDLWLREADAAISIFANPSDELVERCARVLHGHLYGYEGANPNSNPDDEDRHLVRAVLAAAVGEG